MRLKLTPASALGMAVSGVLLDLIPTRLGARPAYVAANIILFCMGLAACNSHLLRFSALPDAVLHSTEGGSGLRRARAADNSAEVRTTRASTCDVRRPSRCAARKSLGCR